MMRKITLVFVALFGLLAAARAQTAICGFDRLHHQMLDNDPAYNARIRSMDSMIYTILSSSSAPSLILNTSAGQVYEIPVVFHVMHTGGAVGTPYNPADTTLQNLITYLNQTYQATYFAYPSAGSGGTYIPVQFAIAKRDPTCNTSTGIERFNASATYSNYTLYGVNRQRTSGGVSDAQIKAISDWDRNEFYNIWIVNKIDSNDGTNGPSGTTYIAGYATLPPSSPAADGTILLANEAKTGHQTLPHEIGHAFGLLHTFEGDDPGGTGAATTCPTNSPSCSQAGDSVCDTEPMQRTTTSCPSNSTTNTCTGVNYAGTQYNFMNYSTCTDRFTAGQRDRFKTVLLSPLRASLISSLGATTMGTNPTSASCSPTNSNPFNTLYDMGPRAVLLADLNGYSNGGYNADGNQVMYDRACWQRANVTAGQTYTIKVQTGVNREKVRVYIDYNNDGVFNTSTELVYSHDGTASTPYETHTGSFAISTASTTVTCAPVRMRVVSDWYFASTSPSPCGSLDYGQAEDYSVYIKAAPNTSLSIALGAGYSNPSCAGSSVGFNATYTGTPSSPTVKYYVNGVLKSTGTSYATNTFVTGDSVTAKLFFTGTCGLDSVVSNKITITRSAVVTPSVVIGVTAGTIPGCAGQSITFTATPTNGGTAPTYKWYVGSTLQPGVTGNTYTTTTLPCNSTVYAQLTSNSACASSVTANSNTISYTCGTQAVSVAISVTGGSNPTCAGKPVTFMATPVNGGTSPTYMWYVNGVLQSGFTNNSFITSSLANGDSVYAVLASNYSCAATPTAQSPAITVFVIPNVTPTVTKIITAGSNPGCKDSLLQFTASAVNAGAAPAYRWYVNGFGVASGAVYNNYTAVTGDKVWVRAIVSGASSGCYARDTTYSDTTTLVRQATPANPFISFIGTQLVSDSSNVQWYGPAGLLPGATGPTFTPTVQGDYYAVISGPLCGTGVSNILTVSPLSVGQTYNMAGVKVYPNPTNGLLTISWSAPATTRITVYTPTGAVVLRDIAAVAARKVLDLSRLAAGNYFLLLQDESGKTGTLQVTLTR